QSAAGKQFAQPPGAERNRRWLNQPKGGFQRADAFRQMADGFSGGSHDRQTLHGTNLLGWELKDACWFNVYYCTVYVNMHAQLSPQRLELTEIMEYANKNILCG